MKKLAVLLSALSLFSCGEKVFDKDQAIRALDYCAKQYSYLIKQVPDSLQPKTFSNDTLRYGGIYWWCSGFYPGCLWYLYEYTKNDTFRKQAEIHTAMLEPVKFVTDNHDLGFMLNCSFGNGYRLIQNEKYKDIMLTGINSLSSRFNPTVGCIKSWDRFKPWTDTIVYTYPVIIDNMMNLEFLMWGSKATGDKKYSNIATTHANTTMKNHFRKDWSSFHVIVYDSIRGNVINGFTAQGFADSSAWSRGQSWGLYGYTMMYRETKDTNYLNVANHIASYILNNPYLPEDMIPYWDYNAPDIPNAKRDASAAAIMASALIELSGFVGKDLSEKYMIAVGKILSSLSSPAYRAEIGKNGGFILMHSVGSIPHKNEIDVPLTYADYYYIEALMRYLKK
jgi:unsaturated chondroitin disaccharide hydrolase